MKFLIIGGKNAERTALKNNLSGIDGLEPELQFAGLAMEGLFKMRSGQPDIVLVDELILESEETLLQQLRQSRSEAAIFVLVSDRSDERAFELIRCGATDAVLRDDVGSAEFHSLIARLALRLESHQFMSTELSKANSRLLSVADSLSNLTWISDESGERFLFNDKWLSFGGHKLESQLSRRWLESIHPQDLKKFWAVYSQAIRAKKSYHVEYRLRRADGQFRLILESGTPMYKDGGIYIGYMGSCADISETRFTQQHIPAYPDQIAQLSTTLDHAPIGVWKLDSNLMITKANPAVAKLFSLEPDLLVGRYFQDLISSVPESVFIGVLEKGERIQLENYPVTVIVDKNRKQVFLDLAAWPLKDKSNNVVGVCVSTTEVTERHLQVQQRDDFVATLVHDLKTPLIGADRALEQMIKGGLGPVDPGQSELLTMLRRSNHQLLAMVQNLIEVYRYDAGEARFMMEEFSLYDVIVASMQEVQPSADHKQIKLKHELPRDAGFIVADRLSIRRVFLNLLDNALKFTSKGGEVNVTAQETDTIVTVSVTDTGIGIPENEQNKLFLRYWQGTTAKAFSPGTGLGLYLCRQIVSAHGGDIKVSSREKIGTTFSVVLPKQAMPRIV